MKQIFRQFIQSSVVLMVIVLAGCATSQSGPSARPMVYQSVWDMPGNRVGAVHQYVPEKFELRDQNTQLHRQFDEAINDIKRGNYKTAQNLLDAIPSQQLDNKELARKKYLLAKIQIMEHQQSPGSTEFVKLAEAKRLQQQALAELNHIQADITQARAARAATPMLENFSAPSTQTVATAGDQTGLPAGAPAIAQATLTQAVSATAQAAPAQTVKTEEQQSAKKAVAPDQSLNKISVALVVPMSGPKMKKGMAVRDGFFAAYAKASPTDRQRIKIKVYDTSFSPDRAALYRMAKSQGADVVIEPLGLMRSSTQSDAAIGEHAYQFATQDMKL
jgi:outer membrane PBP1 activator LpoA protein